MYPRYIGQVGGRQVQLARPCREVPHFGSALWISSQIPGVNGDTAPPSFSFPEHSTTTFPKESFGLPHPSILLGAFGRQILEQYLSSIIHSGTALNSADPSPGIGIYSTAGIHHYSQPPAPAYGAAYRGF
ncbi:uncharacterized protein B0T23DRAFT_81996 [Neurospora hispaniola]|uniref:Uncharacterized protein n=1 Tax=Neurospora hispaniola TaxID=588809 RepID=A0AAJ0ICT8_9PEZI|nr:hypothetical protein B0T23DRAFT_81996 [Neurospora hispaniola]